MNALLLVDIQNDFLPGGALGVPDGDQILPVVNQLLTLPFDCIIASKDWHPPDHGSFAASHHENPGKNILLNGIKQILWPIHCVQGTYGAEFSSGWDASKVQQVFNKGTDKDIDSYSAFFDNCRHKSTGLMKFLQDNQVVNLYIAGLATEYCVKYTVLDALQLGFKVFVVTEACRGVNLQPSDSKQALIEMQQGGAHLISVNEAAKLL